MCDVDTGQCRCLWHTRGVKCDQCEDGYYNLGGDVTDGCLFCGCDDSGSFDDFANVSESVIVCAVTNTTRVYHVHEYLVSTCTCTYARYMYMFVVVLCKELRTIRRFVTNKLENATARLTLKEAHATSACPTHTT